MCIRDSTGYCGISVKAGESYSLYLFAKAKEEIGLDVAIEYHKCLNIKYGIK